MDEIKFITSEFSTTLALPFADGGIRAGFPSPAQDYVDLSLDLNRDLIQNPAATFYAKVIGDSMKDAGILPGDLLVIDRSVEAYDGCKAVCFLNGEFTVKELDFHERSHGIIWLKPYNDAYEPIKVTKEMELTIWGVVTYVIHKTI